MKTVVLGVTGCIGAYLLVGAWSAIAFVGTKGLGFPEPQRGAVVTGVALLASYLALLYPGGQTPRSLQSLGKDAMAMGVARRKTLTT